MTTPTNWPNPERPGEPMFPKRDGCHVTIGPFDTAPTSLLWFATEGTYLFGKVIMTPKDLENGKIYYLGSVLTPAQIAEMLAAERERCVEALQEVSEEYRKNAQEIGTVTATNRAEEKIEAVDDCWVKIRNIGAAP